MVKVAIQWKRWRKLGSIPIMPYKEKKKEPDVALFSVLSHIIHDERITSCRMVVDFC